MNLFGKCPLRKAIERGLKQQNLPAQIKELSDARIRTKEDAEAVCWGFEKLWDYPHAGVGNDMATLAGLLHGVAPDIEAGAIAVLETRGVEQVLYYHDFLDKHKVEGVVMLQFLFLIMLARYHSEEGTARVIRAAQEGFQKDDIGWAPLLGAYESIHPHAARVFSTLAHPLPPGMIGVALLDAANFAALGRSTGMGLLERGEPLEPLSFPHPFNSPMGHGRLRAWLAEQDAGRVRVAYCATEALPFISEPPQRELLELALNHRDPEVKLKAAWAAARCGYELGFELLERAAREGSLSEEARCYLAELGRAEAAFAEATEPSAQAMATMTEWLAHPDEFDRPPDELTVYDTRELYWPPTGDRRRLWLFKFRYIWNEEEWEGFNETKDEMTPEILAQMACEKPGEQAGLGMVGSVTFALFGEVTPLTPPEHAYALHCCWELRANRDPRAPEKRSVEAGLKLLREFNEI